MILPLPSLTLFAALVLAVTAQDTSNGTSTEAFEAEKTVLSTADVADYPELQFGESPPDLDAPIIEKRAQHSCKLQPEDNAWPADILWNLLDTFVGGHLEKPLPLAAPCYLGANYNAAKCATLVATWGDSDLQ